MYTCICHGQSCCAHEGDCHRITGVASDLHTLAPFPCVSLLLLSKHIPFFSLISCHSLHPFPPFLPPDLSALTQKQGTVARLFIAMQLQARSERQRKGKREMGAHWEKHRRLEEKSRQPCIIFLLILTTTVLQENKYVRAHTHTQTYDASAEVCTYNSIIMTLYTQTHTLYRQSSIQSFYYVFNY